MNNLPPTDINSVIQQIEEEGRALEKKELGVVAVATREKSASDPYSGFNNNNNNNGNAAKTKMRLR